jgi:ketosteroid isomerase-like protein
MKVQEPTEELVVAIEPEGVWTVEQREVLDVIRRVTDVQKIGDVNETMEFMHPQMVAWDLASSKSMNRWEFERMLHDSMAKWRFVDSELTPIDLVVDGDVAVAHFRYCNYLHSLDGRNANSEGCWTVTLVRRNGRWLFLSWDWITDQP